MCPKSINETYFTIIVINSRMRTDFLEGNFIKSNQKVRVFCCCTIVHKYAHFFLCSFWHVAPVLAGPGRLAQSAQKEAGLARRRGGGASARKGGQGGGHILRQSPSVRRSY